MKRLKDSGVTIIEAIIGLAILGIGLAFIVPGFSSSLLINNRTETRFQAAIVAQKELENARIKDVISLPTSGQTTPTTVSSGGRSFNVITKYCAITTLCGAGSRHLRVEVSYDSETVFSVDTVYTQLSSSGP